MFKVRCKLAEFVGDEKIFPCHFNYKIGDEFYYDGDHFSGRICPGLFASMMPVIHGVYVLGYKFSENIMYRYRGVDVRDPSMAKYDGSGFRALKSLPSDAPPKMIKKMAGIPKTEKFKQAHFLSADNLVLAHFYVDPVDLSDSEYSMPFFRREIAILERVEKEPGLETSVILDRFTEFERDEINPPLSPALLGVMLDALTDMNYIRIESGKAYPTGKEPPSRPKIG